MKRVETRVFSDRDMERLTRDHLQVGRAMRDLRKALFGLRGGKTPAAKLEAARNALTALETRLVGHMAMEEKALFPFLKRFFPEYDLVIRHLCSEHASFKKYMRSIRRSGSSAGHLKESGSCLLHLLDGHGRIENRLIRRHRTPARPGRKG